MEFIAVVVLSLNLVVSTHASEFLKVSSRTSLLSEIESSLPTPQGSLLTASSYSEIEDSLRPIYESLPKNEHGKLEHVLASYALHRFFVMRHGWVIQGLEPTGDETDASSPASVLKDQVSSSIHDLFEHTGVKGFSLHELAVLAATVTHLIQEETVGRLAAAFALHDAEQKGKLHHLEADKMLDTYMMSYIISQNLSNAMYHPMRQQVEQMPEMFAHWGEAQEFVRAVKTSVMQKEPSMAADDDNVEFGALVNVASAAGEQFGEFLHNKVCKGLKASLMKLEYRDTGRVKLSSFYKPALNGYWQFTESASYLRELGVLEETDPKEPSVMIANYLNAQANCIASSKFYSVCCRNECEELLGHLEEQIAAPEATPETIAALVKLLPSDTVLAPRSLSATLLQRLEEIAASHGGTVPLHGRLFSQWMHHAYPRECPYPHISGTTSRKSPEEWLEHSGSECSASQGEMHQYIHASANSTISDAPVEDLMIWHPQEELLVVRPVGTAGAMRSFVIYMVEALVAGALVYAMVEAKKAKFFGLLDQAVPQKYIV